jgi:type III restriction enzyme
VNLTRGRLTQWREFGYPGGTRTTLELLRYWRRERQQPLFFAQLGAAETIVFLHEARSDLLQGVNVPPEEAPNDVEAFWWYGGKMATGSGKTTVMAMLIAWSILNKVAARGDARFSDVAVVVCPNLTIKGRLGELDPGTGEASIYRRYTGRA